ncbi:MAG: hypothetical protein KatS3mg033_2041 [Thermonema sp.]|jgi:hypothetical protein|uniref:hypothetical protein n=1 Tax=Thermonema sp. TaxID=2231181 RepID=UPI0021DF229A|nr:hypothetical protein [Thermonema sp.]GIV40241.1 MAG: hypothetical protein KatS3mg033_2041 [Thermonema sp.]
MQHAYLQYFIILLLAVCVTACDTTSQEETQPPKEDSLRAETHPTQDDTLHSTQAWIEAVKENIHREHLPALEKQAPEVQLVIGSDSGVVRGIYLGDSIQKVMQQEEAWLIEDSSSFKTFSIDLSRRRAEMIDIQYFTDSSTHQVVESIIVDIYQADADMWYSKMYDYYTARYGTPVEEEKNKRAVWQSPAAYRVVLEKKTIKQAPGIRIRYVPVAPNL